jgi:hypothetical protein
LAIATAACTGAPDAGQANGQQETMRNGPAPDAEIVDLPMDSLNDEDMANDAGEGLERQVVESDR